MVNLWRDRLRQANRRPDEVPVDSIEDFSLYRTLVDVDPLPYSDTLHVDFVGAFSREDVRLVLDRLPAHFRAALVLRYVEGFSTGEIAERQARHRGQPPDRGLTVTDLMFQDQIRGVVRSTYGSLPAGAWRAMAAR